MKVLVSYRYRDPFDFPRKWIRYGKITPRGVRDADAIVSLLLDPIPAAIFEAAPKLKIVANVAAGYENVDLAAAKSRGVWVTNVPGATTESVADLTWALILAVARRVLEGDAMVRGGRFRKWDFHLLRGMEMRGKTLGIVGPGRIGRAVAARAVGFGMRVLFAGRGGLERVLRESDVVSLHTPITAETRRMIDRRRLAMMKRTAILVNTARGKIVEEAALVDALRRGRLAGAGLDVFEDEPRVHPGLLRLKNVVLLPHIGSSTDETRTNMVATAFRNVTEALAGRVPPNLVPELRS